MAHIKLIPPGSYAFDEYQSQVVKVSSRGLVGSDLSDFIKRAGQEVARLVRSLEFHPGEVPVHLIAIGSTEKYGPNRNGDGFREPVCRRYHSTFVKHARFYRDHSNKDPEKSYGIVKASLFNEAMSRIELIVALNGNAEAAKRNKGLVADKELEKLAADKDIGVSMACRVPYDVCSGCGNRARSRDEYCDETMCKYGGLKNNMGKLCYDGHILHADNTEPTFFDISHVYRPADRIAYVLGQIKAASHRVMGGSELAEAAGLSSVATAGRLLGQEVLSDELERSLRILNDLLDLEKSASSNPLPFLKNSTFSEGIFSLPETASGFLGSLGTFGLCKTAHQKCAFLKALSSRAIILPLPAFLHTFSDQSLEKSAELSRNLAPFLSGLFTLAVEAPSFENLLEKYASLKSRYSSLALSDPRVLSLADAWMSDLSLAPSATRRRNILQAATMQTGTVPGRGPRFHWTKQAQSAQSLSTPD
ncbi:MAG: hypothetical protein QXI19_09130, partial [Candidatus Caldarchaeum sp.]